MKGLTRSQAEEEGIKLLKPLKMETKKDEMVSKLSGGMKRKLCLCISLMGNPEVSPGVSHKEQLVINGVLF